MVFDGFRSTVIVSCFHKKIREKKTSFGSTCIMAPGPNPKEDHKVVAGKVDFVPFELSYSFAEVERSC